jgi:spermidine synthase
MSSSSSSRSLITLQLCVLSLLSAFLLFQVQPVISKFILPWFGGSPGVWTTCMLFFQVVLFLGYAYAHLLTRLPRRWQGIIHAVLILAAAISLPIAPGAQWEPKGGDDPTQRIVLLLLANVGLPYFVLSSTSPLVQVWFSRGGSDRAPWRLYALSNLGSLVALLSYPFFFEPRWDVMRQTHMWSWGFGAFALISLYSAYQDWKSRDGSASAVVKENEALAQLPAPSWWRRALWLLLPAVASVFLLASTNHLCQDVAVIPFLWVVPLSLYLLTFIICFEHERWYLRSFWAVVGAAIIFTAAAPEDAALVASKAASFFSGKDESFDFMPDFRWEIAVVCSAMFFGCMVCHGELARLKPHPSRLTEFYLMMSAGGALGGLFVSLVAPRLFNTYMEWPGVLVATFSIAFGAMVLGAMFMKPTAAKVLLVIFGTMGPLLAIQLLPVDVAPYFKPASRIRLEISIACLVLALAAMIVRIEWVKWLLAGIATLGVLGASVAGPSAEQTYFTLSAAKAWLLVVGSGFLIIGAVMLQARWNRLMLASIIGGLAGGGVHHLNEKVFETEPRIERVRNFYGVISVEESDTDDEESRTRTLYHGAIIHGRQYVSEQWSDEPMSYYGEETGIGKALLTLKGRSDARVGVVGMGTGTVAAYGGMGHVYRFYDINPEIVRLARTHFTYLQGLEKHGGTLEVALGDARLSLKNEPAQNFDVLLLDAFSGDSVPVHLLTRDAFEIYKRHMKPDGIIAVHVSNRYLTLAPVVERVAETLGWKTTRIFTELDGYDEATDYVLVTNNEAFLQANPNEEPDEEEPQPKSLWTDQQNNLFEVLTTGSSAMEAWVTQSWPKVRAISGGAVTLFLFVGLVVVASRKWFPGKAPVAPPSLPSDPA